MVGEKQSISPPPWKVVQGPRVPTKINAEEGPRLVCLGAFTQYPPDSTGGDCPERLATDDLHLIQTILLIGYLNDNRPPRGYQSLACPLNEKPDTNTKAFTYETHQ